MMQSISILLTFFFIAQTTPVGTKSDKRVPDVLVDAIRHRASFKTAAFRYKYVVERPGYAPWVRNLEARFADSVLFQRDYGDDEGFRSPADPDTGELHIGAYGQCSPEDRVLDLSRDELWLHNLASPLCGKSVASTVWLDHVDIRTFGLRAIELQGQSPEQYLQMLKQAPAGHSFSVERLNEHFVKVRKLGDQLPNGARFQIEWEIDIEKGPEIIGVREYQVETDGKRELLLEAKNSLAKFDGRWWPIEIQLWSHAGMSTHVRFDSIEFDRPEHPKTINVDTLGIPPGADVVIQGVQGRNHYISGGVTVDHATWEATKAQYDPLPLAQFRARAAAFGRGEFPAWWDKPADTYGLDGVADRPDLWEAYVRRWVIKHTNNGRWRVAEPLTDVQKTGAKGILDDCRKRAVPVRDRLDRERAAVLAELAAIEKQLASAASSAPVAASLAGTSTATTRPTLDSAALKARTAALHEKAAALEKSTEIARLFDELKHRLDGLLTSKQNDPAAGKIEGTASPPIPRRPGQPNTRIAVPAGGSATRRPESAATQPTALPVRP